MSTIPVALLRAANMTGALPVYNIQQPNTLQHELEPPAALNTEKELRFYCTFKDNPATDPFLDFCTSTSNKQQFNNVNITPINS
jgi:hypothetical protein